MKNLLIVAHAPSENTKALVDALLAGCREAADTNNVVSKYVPPLEAVVDDVFRADAIILGTTENLGYMSGALKDFFDRIYYPCLEIKQGLPYALYVRAGHDGTGTCRAVESICTGLRWKPVQNPLVCQGHWNEKFIVQCQELGATIAASLDAGII